MASDVQRSDFYIYAHRRLDTREVFYIGKGCGRRAHYRHGRNALWKRIVAKHGFSVEIIRDGLSEAEAFAGEREMIAAMRPPCNFTDGGDGISGYRHTPATKAALSAAHAGRKQDQSVVAARTEKLRGKKRSPEIMARWVNPMEGKRHTPEARAKMSASRIGLCRSESAKQQAAAWHTGKKRSAGARARMSAAQPKRPVISLTMCRGFPSIVAAAEWLRDNGAPRAGKAGVWAACKRGGTYLGHAWAYADDPSQS